MQLTCPMCLTATTIYVDASDGESCKCDGCDTEFTVSDIRRIIESWTRIFLWLDAHPAKRK